MESNKLTIQINRPVAEVFEFVTNPTNTPKWIDFIKEEQTNESPPRLGTIYRNQDRLGEWRNLEMTEFEQDKMFVMSNRKTGYNVRYTLTPADSNSTKLEYYEWVDQGSLEDPFVKRYLERLKEVIEAGNT